MSPKPRILFVLHLPPPVHGAAVVGEMIRGSERVNSTFDCRYINLSTSGSVEEIGKVSAGKFTAVMHLWKAIREELEDFKPDLVYVTASSSGLGFLKDSLLVDRIKKQGYRVVVHFHNKGVSSNQNPVFKSLYKRFFKGIKVIQLSERLYPDIAAYVNRDDVLFCPNGIPDPSPSMSQCRENSVCHILYLSHLLVSKGILDLLDACRMLQEQGCRFVLDIAGGESAEISSARLQTEIANRQLSDRCICHGWVSGTVKDQVFSHADIFAFPTCNEAFGLVALEAMSRSVPVVCTDEGALPDIVADGESGYIVPRNNPAALASAIGKLLKDRSLRESMGASGRERFLSRYTEDAFINHFTDILQSICQ